MSAEPQFRLRGEVYPIPQNERPGELRLIERVTGLTHRDYRRRAIEQQERLAALGDDDELTPRELLDVLDDLLTVGRLAQAIQRAHPTWPTERVARFVDGLDEDELEMEPGDDEPEADPDPQRGELDEPSSSPASSNGTDSAPQSSSDSATASSESATPPTSGPSTLATSPGARSDQPI